MFTLLKPELMKYLTTSSHSASLYIWPLTSNKCWVSLSVGYSPSNSYSILIHPKILIWSVSYKPFPVSTPKILFPSFSLALAISLQRSLLPCLSKCSTSTVMPFSSFDSSSTLTSSFIFCNIVDHCQVCQCTSLSSVLILLHFNYQFLQTYPVLFKYQFLLWDRGLICRFMHL